MATHTRKKLDIVIEAHLLGRVESILEKAGASGWTVFHGQEGKGRHGIWREDGLVEAMQTRLIVVVCAAEIAQATLDSLRILFERHAGVAYVHDVMVMRSEMF